MNKQLLSLVAAIAIFGGAVAKEKTKIEKVITIEAAVDATVTVEYINHSIAGKAGRILHRAHDEVVTIKAGEVKSINFDNKKLRVRSITVETANGKVQRHYSDETTKLPLVIEITKDGEIKTTPELSYDKNKADKVFWVRTAAVVAAQ